MAAIVLKKHKIIKEVKEMLRTDSVPDVRMREILTEMLSSYKHLENGYEKIIRFADKQQNILLSKAEYRKIQLQLLVKKQLEETLAAQQQATEKVNRLYEMQNTINNLLQTSTTSISLAKHLLKALNTIMTLPWLAIEAKGSIFLWDANKQKLVIVAQQGLSTPLVSMCAELDLGQCLCGLAAKTRKIVFATSIDERHQIMFDGIADHGHYCIPILLGNELLGVLNIYLKKSHVRNTEEEATLLAMANTIAVLIKRRQLEDNLQEQVNYDLLTGLPNRVSLHVNMVSAIKAARRDRTEGNRSPPLDKAGD